MGGSSPGAGGYVEPARDVTLLSGVVNLMLDVLPVLGIVLGFTLIYKYMPYTRVRFGAAAIAGGVVGPTWYLTQWVFIWFQIGVTGNNAIYGAFAALPIFLVWLNTSWIIVLVGCEIAFAAQHESFYRRPVPVGVVSITQRERAAIQVLLRTWKRFVDDSPPERAGDIAAKVDLPRPVTAEIIEALVRCGMLERSARPEEALRPGSDLGQGRLGDLLLAYRHTGKINSGSLGGFLGKEVGAYHESLEAALRRAGSLDLAALTSRPSLISPSFPP